MRGVLLNLKGERELVALWIVSWTFLEGVLELEALGKTD